jgi:hypothetical protein
MDGEVDIDGCFVGWDMQLEIKTMELNMAISFL